MAIGGVFLVALAAVIVVVVIKRSGEPATGSSAAAKGSESALKPEERFAGCRPEDFVPNDADMAAQFEVHPKRFFSTPLFTRLSPQTQAILRTPIPSAKNGSDRAEDFDFVSFSTPALPGLKPAHMVQHHAGGKDLLPEGGGRREMLHPEPGIEVFVDPPSNPQLAWNKSAYATPMKGLLVMCPSEQYLLKHLQAARPSKGSPGTEPLAKLRVNRFGKLKAAYAGGNVEMPAAVTFLMSVFGDDVSGQVAVDAAEKLTLRLDCTAPTAAAASAMGKRIVDLQKGAAAALQFVPPDVRGAMNEALAPVLKQRASIDGARIHFEVELDAGAVDKLIAGAAKMGPPP